MDEVNITYITLNGYVEMNRLKYLYFTVMLMVYILIFLCNGTVFYIICFHKNLHEPMYIFIAALQFNSVVYKTDCIVFSLLFAVFSLLFSKWLRVFTAGSNGLRSLRVYM
uniref:G-protein coupled receptors family 1 profile domain-containing protein n=1 Tax=Poecilia mexicana TaxID=48701 RepID=A0A3B3WBY0_9TELE